MGPVFDEPSDKGEAAETLKKVQEHLNKEDDLLEQLHEHIQEAERKRKQTFDPKT